MTMTTPVVVEELEYGSNAYCYHCWLDGDCDKKQVTLFVLLDLLAVNTACCTAITLCDEHKAAMLMGGVTLTSD